MDDTRGCDHAAPLHGGDAGSLFRTSLNEPPAPETRRPTFEELMSTHRRFIRRTLSRLRVGANDLDDVEIEVLHGIHQALWTFDPFLSSDPPKALTAWLMSICRRQAANHFRQLLRRQETAVEREELDSIQNPTPDAEKSLLLKENEALLAELLTHTKPERRAVLVAYDIEGLSMRDVAAMLKIPTNTAWNRHRLALADLRAAWQRRRAAER